MYVSQFDAADLVGVCDRAGCTGASSDLVACDGGGARARRNCCPSMLNRSRYTLREGCHLSLGSTMPVIWMFFDHTHARVSGSAASYTSTCPNATRIPSVGIYPLNVTSRRGVPYVRGLLVGHEDGNADPPGQRIDEHVRRHVYTYTHTHTPTHNTHTHTPTHTHTHTRRRYPQTLW